LIAPDGRIIALLSAEPEDQTFPLPAGRRLRVIGVLETAAGVALRLETHSGNTLEILVEDAPSLALARVLTLGCQVDIQMDGNDA
jgi:hypothetical protein